ncbi:MAG: primase-helicase zinc-binding domain-containing protein [Chlamydiales bacterium]|nr:primase-helicase zinc-binding domain-containing protein [Chlamydiales bacterium]
MIVELVSEFGLSPKRVASTNGGEYASSCPACGGNDRFRIWAMQDRYWCRRCDAKGDAIQFCRDFLGMDYHSACEKLGREAKTVHVPGRVASSTFLPQIARLPPLEWQCKAKNFVLNCRQNLIKDQGAIQLLKDRGISLEVMADFSLGWNSVDQFLSLTEWGLPEEFHENGKARKLWIPKGIVVPTTSKEVVTKLKVRRDEWKQGDRLPKYVEISGSMKCPSIYGENHAKTSVLLESELDAMLVQQFAGDLCTCIAVGGAGKKPDLESDQLLRKYSLLLFALDFDEAGKKAYQFWRSNYSNLKAWPVPLEKSPGNAYLAGVNLRQWILDGLQRYAS